MSGCCTKLETIIEVVDRYVGQTQSISSIKFTEELNIMIVFDQLPRGYATVIGLIPSDDTAYGHMILAIKTSD